MHLEDEDADVRGRVDNASFGTVHTRDLWVDSRKFSAEEFLRMAETLWNQDTNIRTDLDLEFKR